jgi:cytochrome c oxidase subunit 2
MKRRLPMVGILCVLVGAAGLAWLLGIHSEPWRGDRWPTRAWGPRSFFGGSTWTGGMGPGMMGGCGGPGGMMGPGPGVAYGKRTFASNGEQIYYTGVSRKNGPLLRTGGPMWVQHGGVGCVACHGVHGRGGVPVMMGTALPEDIRYTTLTAADAHEKGEKKDEMDHPPFTDATIKQAVTQGVDPANTYKAPSCQ